MHLNSELLFRKYASVYFENNCKVLEIGPCSFPSVYNQIIKNPTITWHTLDFENTVYINSSTKDLTFRITSPYSFPIETDSYDIVLSGQVIEHVQKIWTWMEELKRVTKSGGKIIIINPVSWPYHEAPVDCWRILPEGMKALAHEVGLNCILSSFESLEKNHLQSKYGITKVIPGRSYNYFESEKKLIKKIKWNKLIGKFSNLKNFQMPIEISYDTISVLEKL